MAFTRGVSMGALVLAIFIAFASSSFNSDEVLNSHGCTGCPVNFEFQNYTIITSQCKGPDYPAQQCCSALLQFACPFADEINDSSNYCASIMFSYINIYGKYPPGLFVSICEGNKEGLNCPVTKSSSYPDTSGKVVGGAAAE